MDNTKSVHLTVEGMTCANCALSIAKYLQKQNCTDVNVDFASGAVVAQVPASVSIDSLGKGINNLGYKVVEEQSESTKPTIWQRWLSLEFLFFTSIVFTLPLIIGMFFPKLPFHQATIQLLLCLPVWLGGYLYLGKSAWSSMQMGVPNMNVLVLLGSSAAFLYSLLLMLQGKDHLYFETAATIITLVLLGNYLEKKAIHQTTSAMNDLVALQQISAQKITIIAGKENISRLNANLLGVGDQILVNVGDRVPTDGVIYWGNGALDEAMISGESLPVNKKSGDLLIAGTMVIEGSFKYRATAVGSHTTLAQIIDMVRRAQADQAPIQRLADRISAIFVPIIVSLSLLTFLINWYWQGELSVALLRAIAVVVVACPCAMGLATPTAMIVSIGRAARNGILIKGANTIEVLSKVKNILFDKTGTLTNGQFVLYQTQFHHSPETTNITPAFINGILLGLEQYSSHPIAVSLVRYFKEQQVQPHYFSHIEEKKSMGMSGKDFEGNEWALLSHTATQEQLSLPDKAANDDLFLLKNQQLVASFQLSDSIKPMAKETIAALQQEGIDSVMVSGDKSAKCHIVAQQIGIEHVYATQQPAQKLTLVEQFAQKNVIAIVGDGINDAPAMAKAQVSISFSNATQVAIQSAKVVLLQDKLPLIKEVISLSQRTMRIIRQNLFWAFFYNILMLPLAAVGWLNPMWAAAAMSLSSLMVVFNSLRLR